jgi:hypothetical protein
MKTGGESKEPEKNQRKKSKNEKPEPKSSRNFFFFRNWPSFIHYDQKRLQEYIIL